MLEKDKIIIVVYYNVDGDVIETLNNVAREFEAMNDGSVMVIVVPVHDTETKIECINPKLVSEKEYEEARKACERIKEMVNNMLLNNENEQ